MASMATDLTPTMLRSVQRLAASARMTRIAAYMEELSRGDGAIDIPDAHDGSNEEIRLSAHFRTTMKTYYPMGFVTGANVSISVLQWLFPSPHPSNVESPLGEFSQIVLITYGLLPHLNATGQHEALDVLLRARTFVGDDETMTESKRQHALDGALRCAPDGHTINILIAHGADPQAVKAGFTASLISTGFSTTDLLHRMDAASIYVENGVFLIGDSTLLTSQLQRGCSLIHARGLLLDGVDPTTALHAAARTLREDVLRAVDEISFVDIDDCAPDDDGKTALLQVVADRDADARPRLATIRTLIELGANVNAHGDNNETALSQAIGQGDHQLIELLLSHGSNADLVDDDGCSSLHIACRNTLLHPYLEHLLKTGANPNLLDREGKTPLDILVSHQEHERLYEAMQLLVSNGGDIDLHDDPDKSPRAMLQRHADGRKVLRRLRDRGLIKASAWPKHGVDNAAELKDGRMCI